MHKLWIAGLFVGVAGLAMADAEHKHHKPPQEAVDACASAAAGDACAFKIHDHDLTGKCFAPPDQTVLACRPDHPPGPPPGDGSDRPPPPPGE